MDAGITAAIITGSCAILGIIVERSMNCVCPQSKTNDKGNIVNVKCVIKCKCIPIKIPNNLIPKNELNVLFEPPFNRDSYRYTSLLDNRYYSVNLPPNLDLIKDGKTVDIGSVCIYREFTIYPITGKYFLDLKLTNISYGEVKIFIKRFDDNWLPQGDNEYIIAEEGLNSVEFISQIGFYDVTKEQVGLAVFSKKNGSENSTCIIEEAHLSHKPLNGIII